MSRGLLAFLLSTISTFALAAPGDTPLSPPIPQAGASSNGGGGTGTPGGSTGQLQINAGSGNFGGITVSGDGTLNTTTGALAITALSGKSVTLGAGLTTTGAGATTLAFGASTETYTFPTATATLAQLGAQTFTGAQTFPASGVILDGSLTGATTFTSANASATNYTLTFPAANDTVATLAATQTLTNKSIVATQLTGTLQAAQEPAHTGDMTNTGGSLATTVLSTNGTAFGALATVTPGTGIATALAVNAGASGAVLVNGNINTTSTTLQENSTPLQLILQRADTSLASATDVSQLRTAGYDNAGTPVLTTWSNIQTNAQVTTGSTADEGQLMIQTNSGGTLETGILINPTAITFSTGTLGGGALTAAITINSSQQVTIAGAFKATTLQSGTASTYACWTSGNLLISSSSAC